MNNTTQLYNHFIKFVLSKNFDNRLVYSVTKKYPTFSKVYKYHNGKVLFKNTKKTNSASSSSKPIYSCVHPYTSENDFTRKVIAYTSPDFPQEKAQYMIDSVRRTKTTISDIVLSNKFDMFATFTFNCKSCPFPCTQSICSLTTPHKKPDCNTIKCNCPPELCKRLNPQICKTRMSKWLENQQEHKSKFGYLIIPEYHHKGGLHFHAMLKSYPGNLIPAVRHLTRKNYLYKGKQVYNIKSYKNGFSTILLIPENPTDHAKVSNYLKKYITKDMPQFPGSKRYWSSRDLIRPETEIGDSILHNPYVTNKLVYESENRMQIYRAEVINNLRKMTNPVMLQMQQTNQENIPCPTQKRYLTQQALTI